MDPCDENRALSLITAVLCCLPFIQSQNCFTSSWLPECSTYTYPSSNITSDITDLCQAMFYMPGCTINNVCLTGAHQTDPYCEDFSVLADICEYDMPRMGGCGPYVGLCGLPNSTVGQCDAFPSIPGLPTTDQANTAIKSMCGQHYMEGCNDCDTSQTGFMQCDLLAVYSKLCLGMPDMLECSYWVTMCESIPTWSEFCPSDDPDAQQPPIMRMYFHTGWVDYVLFETWVPRTRAAYFGTIVAIIILSILYEGIQTFQSYMEFKWNYEHEVAVNGKSFSELDPINPNLKLVWGKTPFRFKVDLQRALLHTLQVIMGYSLMLIAMTFNVGMFLAVLGGIFVGHFFFARFRGISSKSTCCE